ncbi:predicted protein [Botrytis cinerea T4]|uniref:Uncharacterized protein n=1 Tax=Botryotinia fuckeliana (strain T4) TaxID=999810 RepID=G2XNC2_BOTF4|nr:predicted protein [Botrytis cinerea T4]
MNNNPSLAAELSAYICSEYSANNILHIDVSFPGEKKQRLQQQVSNSTFLTPINSEPYLYAMHHPRNWS